ncbi:DUF1800 domain-containing protein [Paucibacter sp. R3-3]|uniref:DUF1800 domain-containing protein n=1 Tax=Roseateles agri TaxID=3098619 RepID=A0ABU5DHU1_9BURK|nr:DUF1800 domain-containing protein [Paucibacter sp. R3-3]MDY0745873.1 DUF1800 domain-containing protein [Paucibacter sp. R3-3]
METNQIAPAPLEENVGEEGSRAASLAAAAIASAALAACGGGGGDDASPASAAPAGAASSADAGAAGSGTVTESRPAATLITLAAAARFLGQAGFAASMADIAIVVKGGYAAWLDRQFAIDPDPVSNYQWVVDKGYATTANLFGWSGLDNVLWRSLLTGPDHLRQRIVLALSEIFVIGLPGINGAWPVPTGAAYVDMLSANAFGSFRSLLEGVALSCGMGVYLNMLGSRKASAAGNQPDENFAREVMQLMTIGLVKLNLDGTPVLDAAGNPIPTYTQTDITNLAGVFTGWTYDGQSSTDPSYVLKPMVNQPAYFSSGAKKVLDVNVPASADGPKAMQIALDTLANHPNVGPFIGRQLIQRLVCSNPSPAYVKRVALAFNDNGAGQRGDMKAVIRAVLLDDEARNIGTTPDAGRLREPVVRLLQWGRTFKAASSTGLWTIGDTSSPANRLAQSPLRSGSVFNFFRPGYVPPNSELGTSGVTAPEFQLCNESSVAAYINFMQSVIANGFGTDVKPDYTDELALAGDSAALVNHVALLLSGSTLSAATVAAITNAVETIKPSSDAAKLNRVCAAVLMVMACPEYLVQK